MTNITMGVTSAARGRRDRPQGDGTGTENPGAEDPGTEEARA